MADANQLTPDVSTDRLHYAFTNFINDTFPNASKSALLATLKDAKFRLVRQSSKTNELHYALTPNMAKQAIGIIQQTHPNDDKYQLSATGAQIMNDDISKEDLKQLVGTNLAKYSEEFKQNYTSNNLTVKNVLDPSQSTNFDAFSYATTSSNVKIPAPIELVTTENHAQDLDLSQGLDNLHLVGSKADLDFNDQQNVQVAISNANNLSDKNRELLNDTFVPSYRESIAYAKARADALEKQGPINEIPIGIVRKYGNSEPNPKQPIPIKDTIEILKPYLTQKETNALNAEITGLTQGDSTSSNIFNRNATIPYENVKAMAEIAEYLHDSGSEFSVSPKMDDKGTMRIVGTLTNSRDQVTMLDSNRMNIGTIYTGQGRLYFPYTEVFERQTNRNQQPRQIAEYPDSRILLRYTLGDIPGEVVPSAELFGRNNKDGSNKPARLNIKLPAAESKMSAYQRNNAAPEAPKYQVPAYDAYNQNGLSSSRHQILNDMNYELSTLEERRQNSGKPLNHTREFIENTINDAALQYKQLLSGTSLNNIQDNMVEQQQELHSFMKEHDLSDNDLETYSSLINSDIENVHDLSPELDLIANKVDELTNENVGTYEDGFDPELVVNMASRTSNGSVRNKLSVALQADDYDYEKFIARQDENDPRHFSTNKFIDKLVKFDEKGPHFTIDSPTNTPEEKFKHAIIAHAQKHLMDSGIYGELTDERPYTPKKDEKGNVIPPKVELDEHGIISWTGQRQRGPLRPSSYDSKSFVVDELHGEVGQIFTRDEKGILHTNFNSGANIDIIPGYMGYIQYAGMKFLNGSPVDAQGNPFGLSRKDRIRAKGFEQMLYRRLDEALNNQSLRVDKFQMVRNGSRSKNNVIDLTTARDAQIFNGLYTNEMYGTHLKKDWYKTNLLPDEDKDLIVKTLLGRVRLDNKFADDAGTFGSIKDIDKKPALAQLMDNHNVREIGTDLIGSFDMILTGSGKTQGIVLYLTEGTTVSMEKTGNGYKIIENPEAKDMIEKGIEPKAPLRNSKYFEYSNQDAPDRQNQAGLVFLKAQGNVPTNTAYMTFNGFTMEDSIVVSKAYAEKHQLVSNDGKGDKRPLTVGDKISTFHSNKATISLVVDPDMSDEEAKKQGILEEVQTFRNNPTLESVQSPDSIFTRKNMGEAREAHENIQDYGTTLDGKKFPISKVHYLITDMDADKKTHTYDVHEAHGRSISPQMSWVLDSMGMDEISKSLFAHNSRNYGKFREYLLVAGYDIDNEGKIKVGYHPLPGEKRQVYSATKADKADNPNVKVPKDSNDLLHQLATHGGMLKLPFELKLASGVKTDMLPIMTSSVRSNNELQDGSMQINDYNRYYTKIFDATKDYYDLMQVDVNEPPYKGDEQKHAKDLADMKSKSQKLAQIQLDQMGKELIRKKLGGFGNDGPAQKQSHLRSSIMSTDAKKAATSIITGDPRLPIDTVAVSQDVYDSLQLKNKDDMVMLARDPMLRDGSLRSFHVQVDNRLTGIAFNPVVTKSFDGDFDGDTYGIINPGGGKKVQEQLKQMSVPNRMLDKYATQSHSYLNVETDVVSGARANGVTKDPVSKDGFQFASALRDDAAVHYGHVKQPISDNDTRLFNTLSANDKANNTQLLANYLNEHEDKKAVYQAYQSNPENKSVQEQLYDNPVNEKELISQTNKYGNAVLQRFFNNPTNSNEKPMLQDSTYNNLTNYMTSFAKDTKVIDNDGNFGDAFKAFCQNKDFRNQFAGDFKNTLQSSIENPSNGNHADQIDRKFIQIANMDSVNERQNAANYLVQQTLKNGNIGSEVLDVTDAKTIENSFEHIAESGAKGSPKKVRDAMEFWYRDENIEFRDKFDKQGQPVLDEHGVPKREAYRVSPKEHLMSVLHENEQTFKAMGFKSDLTGVAGKHSQTIFANMRENHPNLALMVTYPLTQATLQIKHDPAQGEAVSTVLNSQFENLMQGRHSDGSFAPGGTKDNPKKITNREFYNEMQEMYNTAGVDVNPKVIKEFTDVLTDKNGRIQPIMKSSDNNKELSNFKGTPMDFVTYMGGFDTLQQVADGNYSLFDGKHTQARVPMDVLEPGDSGRGKGGNGPQNPNDLQNPDNPQQNAPDDAQKKPIDNPLIVKQTQEVDEAQQSQAVANAKVKASMNEASKASGATTDANLNSKTTSSEPHVTSQSELDDLMKDVSSSDSTKDIFNEANLNDVLANFDLDNDKKSEQPKSATPEQPKSEAPEQPKSEAPEQPKSSTPKQPKSSTPEQPTSSTPKQPTSSTPEQPKSETPEKPKSQTPEKPKSETPEQPKSQTPEQPKSHTPEKPKSETPEQPKSATPEKPKSETPEQPKSETPKQTTTSDANLGNLNNNYPDVDDEGPTPEEQKEIMNLLNNLHADEDYVKANPENDEPDGPDIPM